MAIYTYPIAPSFQTCMDVCAQIPLRKAPFTILPALYSAAASTPLPPPWKVQRPVVLLAFPRRRRKCPYDRMRRQRGAPFADVYTGNVQKYSQNLVITKYPYFKYRLTRSPSQLTAAHGTTGRIRPMALAHWAITKAKGTNEEYS